MNQCVRRTFKRACLYRGDEIRVQSKRLECLEAFKQRLVQVGEVVVIEVDEDAAGGQEKDANIRSRPPITIENARTCSLLKRQGQQGLAQLRFTCRSRWTAALSHQDHT